MSKFEQGFDTQKYLESQSSHIKERLGLENGNSTFMEFGGKPFGDHHAERVLPGYDADCKAQLLADIMPMGKIVMVVNARDILLPDYGRTLQGRIRGDSQLRYDQETIRLISRARELDFEVKDVVVAVTPKNPSEIDKRMLETFRENLFRENVTMHTHYEVDGYPDENVIDNAEEVFGENDVVAEVGNNLIAFSPGGGSGKFGFLLSEIYHSLKNGQNPNFIKFETFPVLTAESDHALNLAFEAATADLQNRVIALCSDQNNVMTTYDKDIENYALLKKIVSLYKNGQSNSVDSMLNPTEMSVNRITDGIVDENIIIEACRKEIMRRINRYKREIESGVEKESTLARANEVFEIFNNKYPPRTSQRK